MSRNLLHKSKLDAFKTWLTRNGIEHRQGRGSWEEVLSVHMLSKNQWQSVFDRIDAPEHYTVAAPLEPLVRRFIRESKKQNETG